MRGRTAICACIIILITSVRFYYMDRAEYIPKGNYYHKINAVVTMFYCLTWMDKQFLQYTLMFIRFHMNVDVISFTLTFFGYEYVQALGCFRPKYFYRNPLHPSPEKMTQLELLIELILNVGYLVCMEAILKEMAEKERFELEMRMEEEIERTEEIQEDDDVEPVAQVQEQQRRGSGEWEQL